MPDGTFELLQVASEIEPVLEIYRKRKPKRVLEIGCWDGGTIKLWLENGNPELLCAVDLNHWNSDAYQGWTKDCEIRLHTGSSLEQDGKDFISENGPFDWLFIDGDHSDEAVRSDWETCLAAASPGAVVILHDITPQAGNYSSPPGVLLNELEGRGYRVERFEEDNRANWTHGLGVVYLP